MNNILDKSLDSQFDKIENLTWFPWVGKGYKCAKRKLLVVGESHYLNEDSDENNEKRRELLIRDKEHTRNCLYEVLINKSWSSKTYSNIMEALCDRGILSDNKTALSEIVIPAIRMEAILKKRQAEQELNLLLRHALFQLPHHFRGYKIALIDIRTVGVQERRRPFGCAVPCPRNRLASAESQAGCCQH